MSVKRARAKGPVSPLRREPTQERGRARVEAILDAAAREFDAVGFASATTAAVAARAGVPIGTLYQFFSNKEALLHALGARFQEQTLAYFDTVLESAGEAPLESLVDRVVDSMAAFHLQQPGFRTLMTALQSSQEVATGAAHLQGVLAARVERVLRTRAPALRPKARARVAVAAVHVANLLSLLPAQPDARSQRALVRETKVILVRYLAPYEQASAEATARD